MRTYAQLSSEERILARQILLNQLVTALVECRFVFDDAENGETLQYRIDGAVELAHSLGRPQLAAQYVLREAGVELRGIATAQAEARGYPDQPVVRRLHS
jgi:hypothetical protein